MSKITESATPKAIRTFQKETPVAGFRLPTASLKIAKGFACKLPFRAVVSSHAAADVKQYDDPVVTTFEYL
jgi:hypothetical protein